MADSHCMRTLDRQLSLQPIQSHPWTEYRAEVGLEQPGTFVAPQQLTLNSISIPPLQGPEEEAEETSASSDREPRVELLQRPPLVETTEAAEASLQVPRR